MTAIEVFEVAISEWADEFFLGDDVEERRIWSCGGRRDGI
jgi:hypothetical protein